jgi:hypothetical protein
MPYNSSETAELFLEKAISRRRGNFNNKADSEPRNGLR